MGMSINFHLNKLRCNSKLKNLFLIKEITVNSDKSTSNFLMIAKTMHGLEDVLAKELQDLGAEKIKKVIRAVEFYGDTKLLYKCNICLRTALRILKPISFFKVKNENELYNKTKQINWENYISLNDTFIINTTISNSRKFNHNQYISQKVKDAIVDQFREKYGRRPSINKFTPTIRINIHIKNEVCQVSLDSSGDSLHKRGYRIQKGEAPINEVLAAGIVLLSEWDQKKILKDPMCGSGTIVIEAAMIAKNQAPNKNRKQFGFMKWKDFEENKLQNIREDLTKNEKKINKIEGSDYHFRAISAARKNIHQANISENIELSRFDFLKQKKINEERHVIFNPPYGERLEILDQDFYKKMGNILKNYYTKSTVWIITSDYENIKFIGLKPSRKIKLFNGSLECNLLKYELYSGNKKE